MVWDETRAHEFYFKHECVDVFLRRPFCCNQTLFLLGITYGYNSDGTIQRKSQQTGLGWADIQRTDTPIKESEIMTPADMIAIGDVFVEST